MNMFRLRTTPILSRDEISRQQQIWNFLTGSVSKPTTRLEQKVAAVWNHHTLNPIHVLKLMKLLQRKEIDDIKDYDQMSDIEKQRIRNAMKTVSLETGDVLHLAPLRPFLLYPKIKGSSYKRRLDLQLLTRSSLVDFERIMFDNKITFNYLSHSSFANYVYLNMMHYLGVSKLSELLGNDNWRSKVAKLIETFKFSDYFTKLMFYQDFIEYEDKVYNTSDIPKYDVNQITPKSVIPDSTNELESIQYRESVNLANIEQIPDKYRSIFAVFPFKDQHFVDELGRVHFIDVDRSRLKSLHTFIKDLCTIEDINAMIENASQFTELDEVLNYAVHTNAINEQGIALLIARQLVGNVAEIGSYRIYLPTINDVLSWTKLICNKPSFILPPIYENAPLLDQYVKLVKDIAECCFTKLDVAFLCSTYQLPAFAFQSIYRKLTNDAERYVFLTICLQQYAYNMFQIHRDKLTPIFHGDTSIDLSKYNSIKNMYDFNYNQSLPQIPLIDETVNIIPDCMPNKCMELYEFVNKQLNELVAFGDTQFTLEQKAALLSQMLN